MYHQKRFDAYSRGSTDLSEAPSAKILWAHSLLVLIILSAIWIAIYCFNSGFGAPALWDDVIFEQYPPWQSLQAWASGGWKSHPIDPRFMRPLMGLFYALVNSFSSSLFFHRLSDACIFFLWIFAAGNFSLRILGPGFGKARIAIIAAILGNASFASAIGWVAGSGDLLAACFLALGAALLPFCKKTHGATPSVLPTLLAAVMFFFVPLAKDTAFIPAILVLAYMIAADNLANANKACLGKRYAIAIPSVHFLGPILGLFIGSSLWLLLKVGFASPSFVSPDASLAGTSIAKIFHSVGQYFALSVTPALLPIAPYRTVETSNFFSFSMSVLFFALSPLCAYGALRFKDPDLRMASLSLFLYCIFIACLAVGTALSWMAFDQTAFDRYLMPGYLLWIASAAHFIVWLRASHRIIAKKKDINLALSCKRPAFCFFAAALACANIIASIEMVALWSSPEKFWSNAALTSPSISFPLYAQTALAMDMLSKRDETGLVDVDSTCKELPSISNFPSAALHDKLEAFLANPSAKYTVYDDFVAHYGLLSLHCAGEEAFASFMQTAQALNIHNHNGHSAPLPLNSYLFWSARFALTHSQCKVGYMLAKTRLDYVKQYEDLAMAKGIKLNPAHKLLTDAQSNSLRQIYHACESK